MLALELELALRASAAPITAAAPAAQIIAMDPCRLSSEPRVRLRYLGVVGLGCLVMQLLAVLPYKNCKHGCEHWATISDSTVDSAEIPDEIPNKGYDYHKVAYNLWNAIEGFCTHANVSTNASG